MSDLKRVLVLGCGSIGERHIRCMTQVGGAAIIACDTRPERLEAMRELYGVAETALSYDDADLSGVDAVMVCTPTDQHIGPAMRAAESGCHIFVEKPLSVSMEGVDDLIALCKGRGLVFQMGYVMRHHPGLREVSALLDIGTIGKVNVCTIKSAYNIGKYRPDYPDLYWAHASSGGGVIWDASHQQDWIQWLMGPIVQVCAMREHFMLDIDADVEDAAVMILRFASGAIGSISLSNCQRDDKRTLELNGTRGSLEWCYDTNEVRLYTEEDNSWRVHRTAHERDDFFMAQARNFLGAIRGENPPAVTGIDGRRALMVSLAAYESAATGKVVSVNSCMCEGGCG